MSIPRFAARRPPRRRASAKEFVYNTLRHSILHLHLKPGTKMSEQEISEEFKVSRTPVREVFVHLHQDGLVEIYPQRGTYVSLINLESMEEGRWVREIVETAVVEEAAGRLSDDHIRELEYNLAAQEQCCQNQDYLRMLALDDEFHAAIFRACGKQLTYDMVKQLNLDFYRVRVLRLSHDSNWEQILRQHQAVFQALREGKAQEARKIMTDHLRMIMVEEDELLAQYPGYFVQASRVGTAKGWSL
ncbi:MAG: GntR family transcriptional regulator [Firmicutes bacterium]|nr:GntR family transcriptional regulator [Bacillota bacterium]